MGDGGGRNDADTAKELISLVVAQVRKGAPKTRKIGRRKQPQSDLAKEPVPPVLADPAEVTEQLRKFENMIMIQRLDTLIDMQKMQWEILARISAAIEAMGCGLVGDSGHGQIDYQEQDHETADDDESERTEELGGKLSAKDRKDIEDYDRAEAMAHRISRVKNEIN